MVTAGRQRMWGGAAGGLGMAEGGGVNVGGDGGFAYQGDAALAAAGGGGSNRTGVIGRLSGEAVSQQRQQQQQQHQGQQGRRADSNDGSGGSDDFVLVDGTASTDSNTAAAAPAAGVGGGHAHAAYRLAGEGDADSLGPRLVIAGGRWAWGGTGNMALGLQQQGLGAAAPRPADGPGAGDSRGAGAGAALPSLSLEGVLRCLQIVELFGRRAVLLAELGDSRVAPAMRCRQKSKLDVHARAAAAGAWMAGDAAGDGTPAGSFAQTRGGNFCAFSRDNPPLFADIDEPWLPSSSSHSACQGSRSGAGGGDTGILGSSVSSSSAACCDSHRLFGEALVLYLKSLSMAKEAIVWGNQALECLPVSPAAAAPSSSPPSASSSRHHAPNQPPPPSPPPPVSSPVLAAPPPPPPPTGSPDVRSQSGGRAAVVEGGTAATAAHDDFSSRSQQQQQQQQQQARQGSGKLAVEAADGPVSSRASASGVGSSSSSSSAAAPPPPPLSSEAQVAAWGSSLLLWLSGQFSAVLRRAERCRTELRGSASTESPAATAAATSSSGAATTPAASDTGPALPGRGGASAATSSSSGASGGVVDHAPAVPALAAAGSGDGRGRAVDPDLGLGGATLVSASPERSSAIVAAERRGGGGGGAAAAQGGHEHGAAPAAVAVSARDIVVRAALAMAKESAASEVLGMWEPARKGYEKAALLLETLLLDALVARPEATGANPNRSAVGSSGQPGPAAAPKLAWGTGGGGAGVPGDSLIASGTRGGMLTEADQRVLQNYMTRFARRAADVAANEKEEARITGSEGTKAGTTEPSEV
ncbi:unnamed protein product [Ectocarpus sp. 12 AP-2014]